jgi:hypothetical protein
VGDPLRLGVEATGPTGQVAARPLGRRTDGGGVEDHDVGEPTLTELSPVAQPVQPSRYVAQQRDGLLERQEMTVAHGLAHEEGGVGGAAHHVEVGAGVRPADHHTGIPPHVGPQPPAVVGLPPFGRPETGAEAVGHHDVEQRVERRLPPLGRHVAHRAPFVGGRLGGERLVEPEDLPVGQRAEQTGVG